MKKLIVYLFFQFLFFHHTKISTSADNCQNWNSCSSCVSSNGCGYDQSSKKCYTGDNSGPSDSQIIFSNKDWVFGDSEKCDGINFEFIT